MPEIADIESFIARVCQDFQLHHDSADKISVEQYLKKVDLSSRLTDKQGGQSTGELSEDEYRKLVASLVQCEIRASRKTGKALVAQDYVARFPEFSLDFFRDLISLPELPAIKPKSSFPKRYQQKEKIGTGGIGEVWRVYDQRMQRTLAIKLLRPNFRGEPAANIRLRQEAVLTGGLQHPGIPPVYDLGLFETGGDFFAMKLVEGKTLAEILKSRPDDLPFLIGVFQQIAQTIAYAHSRQTIHRDLKPQNVMVGEFGEVQVMDWGLAKQIQTAEESKKSTNSPAPPEYTGPSTETAMGSIDSSIVQSTGIATKHGDLLGTPAYMPPEQAQGKVELISTRSDVFGLGVVLFEILAGQRLYAGGHDLLTRVANADHGSIEERLGERKIDAKLIELCALCLQPNPQDRPKDASFVAAEIEAYQLDVQNRLKQAEIDRSSALVQSRESQKRFKVFAAMSTVVVLVSVIGAAGFAWQWNKTAKAGKLAAVKAETLKEVNEFFTLDLLSQANPYQQPDRDLTIRVALDRAADRISDRFENRPLIEGEIRLQIGVCYFGLGEYLKAKHQISIAYDLFTQADGSDSKMAIMSLQNLAALEHELGNHQKSLDMFRELNGHSLQRDGADSLVTLRLQSNMSNVLKALGLLDEAEEKLRYVVLKLDELGLDDIELETNRVQLAIVLIEKGEYVDAEKILAKVIDEHGDAWKLTDNGVIRIPTTMSEFSTILNAKEAMAGILEFQRKYDEAEELLRECIFFSDGMFGPVHKRTLIARDNLAMCLMRQNHYNEAEELLVETVDDLEKNLGENHTVTISAKNSLASAYVFLREFDKAKPIFLEVREKLQKKYDFQHPDLIVNTNNLAGLYYKTGQYDKAIVLTQEAFDASKEVLGLEHPRTIITLASLASTHEKLGENEKAEKEFLQSLELAPKAFPYDHSDTRLTMSSLITFYLKNDRRQEAAQWIEKLIPLEVSALGAEDQKTIQTKNALAKLLSSENRFLDAQPYFVDVFEAYREVEGETSSEALTALYALLNNEDKLGRNESVKSRLLDLKSKIDRETQDWLYLKTESKLGKALAKLGEFDLAETKLLNTYRDQENCDGVTDSSRAKGLRTTALRLIRFYETTQDEPNAKKWKEVYKNLKNADAPKPTDESPENAQLSAS